MNTSELVDFVATFFTGLLGKTGLCFDGALTFGTAYWGFVLGTNRS
jgi:hypothetical protein